MQKIIVDTDPGVDDVLALLLLLTSPDISIELISVTFGNTSLRSAYGNVLKLYSVLRKHVDQNSDVSRFPGFNIARRTLLAKGAERPIEGSLEMAAYYHGNDGLSEISSTHKEFDVDEDQADAALEIISTPAEDAIIKLLASEPENSVIILALGPLSTIAKAIRKDLKTMSRVSKIVCMGGALDAPGNTSSTAEFNFYADPFSVNEVLQASSGLFDVILVPLDITMKHSVPFEHLVQESNVTTGQPPVLHKFLEAILSRPRRALKELGATSDAFEMHDPLAAFYVTDNASPKPGSWKLQRRRFVIERTGEWTKGMCVVDRRGTTEVEGAVRTKDGISHVNDAEVRPADSQTANKRVLEATIVIESPGIDIFSKHFVSRVILGAK